MKARETQGTWGTRARRTRKLVDSLFCFPYIR